MNKSGFSLVELSIVLVILGLLTGGILTGQNLIRAAELRSVTTEFQHYQTAAMAFKDKYFYLPGDMPNATDFWGAAHSTPSTCRTTASAGTETCNGDANGRLQHNAVGSNEHFRFWQQLANADLIAGTYTGVGGVEGNIDSQIGVNVPPSKLSNAGWSATWSGQVTNSASNFDGNYGNLYTFGGEMPGNGATLSGAVRGEEAWTIDSKIDDGRPAYGSVRGRKKRIRQTVPPVIFRAMQSIS